MEFKQTKAKLNLVPSSSMIRLSKLIIKVCVFVRLLKYITSDLIISIEKQKTEILVSLEFNEVGKILSIFLVKYW